MSRSVLAASIAAALLIVACGAAPVAPSSPSADPTGPASPTLSPSPSPEPTATPSVAPSNPPVTPAPSPVEPTEGEAELLDGVQRGAIDCEPVRDAADLPPKATAGIECASDSPKVARIGFYRFATEADMLAAYRARMTAEGIEPDSGDCVDGEGEGAYVPGEGEVAWRHGCFLNDRGVANYRATLPGWHVYIGILGTDDDMIALQDFAWLGSQDTPGSPTLWSAAG